MAALLAAVAPAAAMAGSKTRGKAGIEDRASSDFLRIDGDGDGRISRAEWRRRGNFERLDSDGDGFLGLMESRAHYGETRVRGTPPWRSYAPPAGPGGPAVDASAASDRLPAEAIGREVLCAIGRMRGCPASAAAARGLLASGLGPVFAAGAACQGIDDYFAMDYGFKRDREAHHGGIDLPAPFGTPMIAAAAGTVVGVFQGRGSKRGMEVVLRHAPADTGLALWTYTQYAHLDALPEWRAGRRVAMGEVIGPTGNSGVSGRTGEQSSKRRPAIHFAAWYAQSGKFAVVDDVVVPVDGYWLDPLAFYRAGPPFDSAGLKALPEAEKEVRVPVVLMDGTTLPANTRRIWPYPCRPD